MQVEGRARDARLLGDALHAERGVAVPFAQQPLDRLADARLDAPTTLRRASRPRHRAHATPRLLGRHPRPGREAHGQGAERVAPRVHDALGLAADPQIREPRDRLPEDHDQLEPRQTRAQAEVAPAAAEGVVVGLEAVDVELLGALEDGLVAGRARVPHDHAVARGDLPARDLGVAGGGAVEPLHDARPAQDLLDGAGDQVRVGAQLGERVGVVEQRADAAGCGVARGVVPGEGEQPEEDEDLAVVERTAVDLRVAQSREHGVGAAFGGLARDLLAEIGASSTNAASAASGSGERVAASTSSVQERKRARSSSGTPSSSESTPIGTGTASSRAMSAAPRSTNSSIVASTRERIGASSARTAWGVKTLCRIVRYFVCVGGSMYSSRLRFTSSGRTWSGCTKTPPA